MSDPRIVREPAHLGAQFRLHPRRRGWTALSDVLNDLTNVGLGRISQQVSPHRPPLCRLPTLPVNRAILTIQLLEERLAVGKSPGTRIFEPTSDLPPQIGKYGLQLLVRQFI